MKAAILTKEKYQLDMIEKDIPNLTDKEVLVKVDYCGVCGSDLHAYAKAKGYEFVKPFTVLGHEISGTVVEVANEKDAYLKGEHVIVESMNYCGSCENCLRGDYSICINNKVIGLHYDGGMAQYVKTESKYIRIVEGLAKDISVLSEPMTIAIHAINKSEKIKKDSTVLVTGAGIIGFFSALAAYERGATVYISGLKNDYEARLKKYKRFNLIPLISGEDQLDEKVDVVVECSGSNAAINWSLENLKKGGEAILVALYEATTTIFFTDLVRNEKSIITSYGSNPKEYDQALTILAKYEESLRELISYYDFESISKSFDDSIDKKVLKAVLKMN